MWFLLIINWIAKGLLLKLKNYLVEIFMNIKNYKKIIFSVLSFIFFFSFFTANYSLAASKEGNPINVYIFHGDTCPHCKKELGYLDQLSKEYNFELKKFEVYNSKDNRDLMARFAKAYNTNFDGVPTTIIGYEYIIGENFEKTKQLIQQYGFQKEYVDPYQIVLDYEKSNEINSNIKSSNKDNIDASHSTKIFGKEIKIDSIGPVFFGVLLGLADGINPCMFGVLIFFLTYLISVGSKKKVLISGLIFVASTFIFYYLVMFGMHNLLFSVSAFLPYVGIFKIIIGCIALFMAVLEIKDFFFYGQGWSLRIPSFAKPTIEFISKRGTYLSAFVLAMFSSIVELPCTIGIPLTYIAATEKTMNIFFSLFVYNIAFIIPLIIIILGVYKSSEKIENGEKLGITNEKYKKIMRLVAGVILLIMGLLLVLGKI